LRQSPVVVSQCRGMKVDVVVAGGGMVGSAAAAAIAQLGCMSSKTVMLLEAGPQKETVASSQYSNRVSALSPSSVGLLSQLGAWQTISQSRLGLVTRMKVWDSCSTAGIVFSSDNVYSRDQPQPLNYIVENDLTVSALTGVIKACDNLVIKYGAKVKRYKIPQLAANEIVPEENVEVILEDGTIVETSLLVGADGFRSLVRESIGSDYCGWDYPQSGLVATLNIETSGSNSTAWQRFLPSGPVAVLPLSEDRSSLVWTVQRSEARPLLEMSDQDFVKKLNRALTSDVNQNELVNSVTNSLSVVLRSLVSSEPEVREDPPLVTGVSSRASFPLGFGHSVRYTGPRTVLIGDSAHRVHPLAGQGVNLGFGDVISLAGVVEESVRSGALLGGEESLCRYETERQRHNLPTMLGIDALQKLYSSQATPVVLARSLGLLTTNAVSPVKKLILQHASS